MTQDRSNHVVNLNDRPITGSKPEWTYYGEGLYRRKYGTLWVALMPGQIAMLRSKTTLNYFKHDHLEGMLNKGQAVELDDGAIVIRVEGVMYI
jgi:hypothetical protein